MSGSYASPGPPAFGGQGETFGGWLGGQRGRAPPGGVLGTLWMVGLTLPPYLLSRAIDDGLQPGHFSTLVRWVSILFAVGVLNAYVSIMRHRTMTKVRMDGAFRTVHALVEQSTKLGAALTRKVTAGEVVTIGISDVWVISTSLTFVGPGVGGVIAYFVVAGLLLAISPLLALIVLLGVPVLAVLVGPLLGRLRQVGSVYRERQGGLTTRMVDMVEGLRVLNGIGGKGLYAERYRASSQRLQAEGFRVGSVASWIPAVGVGLPVIFLAAVTWLAARMSAAHTISIGDLVAVYGYVAVLVVPVGDLIESGSNLSQSVVSARRVIALLSLEPDSLDRSPTQGGPTHPGDLLDPESGVEVASGRLTALASARLADSAAVIDRLGRFCPSEVTWGGVCLDEIALRHVRGRILVADNEADIFGGTLRDVIAGRLGRDDEAISRALHTAAAEDIVMGLPDGLSSAIAPQARNLSGGERQRIRLVRALLAEPEVLLAAEPTSAVDAHTEATIATRLRAARAGRTTLVTTTSPLLLDQADVVHYLVEGHVVATGTHRELMTQQPGYHRLVSRGLDDEHDVDPLDVVSVPSTKNDKR